VDDVAAVALDVVKVGRIWDGEVDIPAERSYYHRGAMRIPAGHVVPLVVDHNLEGEIGIFDELVEWDDVDGIWLATRCQLRDPVLAARRQRRELGLQDDPNAATRSGRTRARRDTRRRP
jgi:hypothetical protein